MPVPSLPIFLLAAARTPFGAFGGSLKGLPAPELAARALEAALQRSGLEPSQVRELILGCAFPAGLGPEPARQAALAAGLDVPAYLVSMGAGSGLKAVLLAAEHLGASGGWALAGGMENTSRVPYLVPDARWGRRVGAMNLIDGLLVDGMSDAEATAPGAWSAQSRARLGEKPSPDRDLAPLTLERRGQSLRMEQDEDPRTSRVDLPPSVAPPADGAAVVLLGTSAPTRPLGRVLGWNEGCGSPRQTVEGLLEQTDLALDKVDLWECHEGSEAMLETFTRALPEVDTARLNVHGGALALGDPRGASGGRLLGALLQALEARNLNTGIVVVPTEGGQILAAALARG